MISADLSTLCIPKSYACILKAAAFMDVMVIMKGPPGSGKTTMALALKHDLERLSISTEIHSTDNYFLQDGVYNFCLSLLEKYHHANYMAAMKSQARVVIVDNTNLNGSAVKYYDAQNRRYMINLSMKKQPLDVLLTRNVHSVPRAVLERMNAGYEDERLRSVKFYATKPIPFFRSRGPYLWFDHMNILNANEKIGTSHTYQIVATWKSVSNESNISKKFKKRKRDVAGKRGMTSKGNCQSCGDFNVESDQTFVLRGPSVNDEKMLDNTINLVPQESLIVELMTLP